MRRPKLTGHAQRWIVLAIKEAFWKVAKLSETEDGGEREMVETVVPVHQFLLDGSQVTRPRKSLRFLSSDSSANLLAEGQGCGWNVGKIRLQM